VAIGSFANWLLPECWQRFAVTGTMREFARSGPDVFVNCTNSDLAASSAAKIFSIWRATELRRFDVLCHHGAQVGNYRSNDLMPVGGRAEPAAHFSAAHSGATKALHT
jgi:hypothetical protein